MLNPVQGSEQGGERPGLVISADIINANSPVVLVAPITSKRTEKIYPFEAVIHPPDGGLTMRSKVSFIQLRTLDKSRLVEHVGTLAPETMEAVERALRIATGLFKV
ncbi:MAG: type II toxin-antitoxin system PemK/MazF family toxin [Acidobacteria bacterium]|nr:type II toxin-antitoxin system PemK/MazF family toxin [Acidobacteriota bacterium]